MIVLIIIIIIIIIIVVVVLVVFIKLARPSKVITNFKLICATNSLVSSLQLSCGDFVAG